MRKPIGGHSKISCYVLRLQDPSDIADHRLSVQEVTNAAHAGATVMGGWPRGAYQIDPLFATIRGSILVHADTDLWMLAASNMSDQNLWGHGRHGHLWHPHQHVESGTASPALVSLISDGMLGHVPFNLCEVHELSRVALCIRQQALFTLIQRNPAHQVSYAPDTIRQMVQMIQAHLLHRAARRVRDMLTSTGPTEVTLLFMIGLATRACLLWQFRSSEHLLNPSPRLHQHFTEHGQYALKQVPGLSCSIRLVVVNIDAIEIDAAQRPLDANNDDSGDIDDVNDRTSDGALADLIVDSRLGLDTVSQSSVHDNATITTHHRPSLPATTLPVLMARGSRASARQARDATSFQGR